MGSSSAISKQATTHDLLVLHLRQLMRQANLNEAALSRKTDIPQATLHKILAGKTQDPRASTLKVLADFFGISIDALLSGNDEAAHTADFSVGAQSMPIISWKECVSAAHFISTLTPTNWEKWIVSEFVSHNAYALCTKPSMEPRFPKNTILLIDPDIKAKDGDFVVVFYSGTEEATLRELSTDGPVQLLLPISANAESTKLDAQVRLLGVLVRSSFLY